MLLMIPGTIIVTTSTKLHSDYKCFTGMNVLHKIAYVSLNNEQKPRVNER